MVDYIDFTPIALKYRWIFPYKIESVRQVKDKMNRWLAINDVEVISIESLPENTLRLWYKPKRIILEPPVPQQMIKPDPFREETPYKDRICSANPLSYVRIEEYS